MERSRQSVSGVTTYHQVGATTETQNSSGTAPLTDHTLRRAEPRQRRLRTDRMKHARLGGRAEAYQLALVAYCVGEAVRSSSDRPDVVHDPSQLVHSADCCPSPLTAPRSPAVQGGQRPHG
jgi:hypothetical protein